MTPTTRSHVLISLRTITENILPPPELLSQFQTPDKSILSILHQTDNHIQKLALALLH